MKKFMVFKQRSHAKGEWAGKRFLVLAAFDSLDGTKLKEKIAPHTAYAHIVLWWRFSQQNKSDSPHPEVVGTSAGPSSRQTATSSRDGHSPSQLRGSQ